MSSRLSSGSNGGSASALDSRDRDGVTPLMDAAQRGDTTLAEWLIQEGATVNLTCANGCTALDYLVACHPSYGDGAAAVGASLHQLLITHGGHSHGTNEQRAIIAARTKQREGEKREKAAAIAKANYVSPSASVEFDPRDADSGSPVQSARLTTDGARTLAMLTSTESDDEELLKGMFSPLKPRRVRRVPVDDDDADTSDDDSGRASASAAGVLRSYFSTPPLASPSGQRFVLGVRSSPSTPQRVRGSTSHAIDAATHARIEGTSVGQRLPAPHLPRSLTRDATCSNIYGEPVRPTLPTSQSATQLPSSASASPARPVRTAMAYGGGANPWKMGLGMTMRTANSSASSTPPLRHASPNAPSHYPLHRSNSHQPMIGGRGTGSHSRAASPPHATPTRNTTSASGRPPMPNAPASTAGLGAPLMPPSVYSSSHSSNPITFFEAVHDTPSRLRHTDRNNLPAGSNASSVGLWDTLRGVGRGTSATARSFTSAFQHLPSESDRELIDFSNNSKTNPHNDTNMNGSTSEYDTPMSPLSPQSLELLLRQHTSAAAYASAASAASSSSPAPSLPSSSPSSDVLSPASVVTTPTALSHASAAAAAFTPSIGQGIAGGLNKGQHGRILSKTHSSSSLLGGQLAATAHHASTAAAARIAGHSNASSNRGTPVTAAAARYQTAPPHSPAVLPPPAMPTAQRSDGTNAQGANVTSSHIESDYQSISTLLDQMLSASSIRGVDVSIRNIILLALPYFAPTDAQRREVLSSILSRLSTPLVAGGVPDSGDRSLSSSSLPSFVSGAGGSSGGVTVGILQRSLHRSESIDLTHTNTQMPVSNGASQTHLALTTRDSTAWYAEKLRAFSVLKYWLRTYPMDFADTKYIHHGRPVVDSNNNCDSTQSSANSSVPSPPPPSPSPILSAGSLSSLLSSHLSSYPPSDWIHLPSSHMIGLQKLSTSTKKMIDEIHRTIETNRTTGVQQHDVQQQRESILTPTPMVDGDSRLASWPAHVGLMGLPVLDLAHTLHAWTIARMRGIQTPRELLKFERKAAAAVTVTSTSNTITNNVTNSSSPPLPASSSSTLNQMQLSNQVSLWSGTELLCAGVNVVELPNHTVPLTAEHHASCRLIVFRKLIGCALVLLRQYGNFNAAFEIIIGLNIQATYRIVNREIEKKLTDAEKRTWKRLNDLMHSSDNYKAYRQLYSSLGPTDLPTLGWSDLPVSTSLTLPAVRVPYLGVVCKDIVAIEEGGAPIIKRQDEPEDKHDRPAAAAAASSSSILDLQLHVPKCRALSHLLSDALKCQHDDADGDVDVEDGGSVGEDDSTRSSSSLPVRLDQSVTHFARCIQVALGEAQLCALSHRIIPIQARIAATQIDAQDDTPRTSANTDGDDTTIPTSDTHANDDTQPNIADNAVAPSAEAPVDNQ